MPINTKFIKELKRIRPIVATTAYDSIISKLADDAGVDILLVGDSVGTTQLGFDSTIHVSLEMMIHHTAAVSRVCPNALVVSDLPFGYSYDEYDVIFHACRELIQKEVALLLKLKVGLSLHLR